AHHRFHQRLLHEICHVPSQHSVERLRGVSEVLGQESLFVENFVVVLVPVHKRGITGGEQHVFAVNFVAQFGKVADVGRGGRSNVEHAKGIVSIEGASKPA